MPEHLHQIDCWCTILSIRWSNTAVRRPESPNAWQRDPEYALGVRDDNNLIIYGGFISYFTVPLGKKKENKIIKQKRDGYG